MRSRLLYSFWRPKPLQPSEEASTSREYDQSSSWSIRPGQRVCVSLHSVTVTSSRLLWSPERGPQWSQLLTQSPSACETRQGRKKKEKKNGGKKSMWGNRLPVWMSTRRIVQKHKERKRCLLSLGCAHRAARRSPVETRELPQVPLLLQLLCSQFWHLVDWKLAWNFDLWPPTRPPFERYFSPPRFSPGFFQIHNTFWILLRQVFSPTPSKSRRLVERADYMLYHVVK